MDLWLVEKLFELFFDIAVFFHSVLFLPYSLLPDFFFDISRTFFSETILSSAAFITPC